MASQTQIVFNSRIPQARMQVHDIIKQATLEVFATQIHPAAVEKSPVTPEGLARNLELLAEHKLGGRPPGGTGTNRRSIDFTVEASEKGVVATLFTQSGYGGWLEVGTSKMRAQPYLWPAFIENVDKIPAAVKVAIEGLGTVKK